MLTKLLIATASDSLAQVDPELSITDPERALQLYEQRTGYGQWKVIFPGSVVLSDKVALLLGLPVGREALPLQDMVKAYHQEDRGKLLTLIAQSLEGRRGFHCRLRVDRHDGQVRMVETIADLRMRDGKVVELFGATRDATLDAERELQVQGRLKLVQDLVADLPSPIVVVDDKLRVLDCSIHWLKAHRFIERREVVGKTLGQLFPDLTQEMKDEHERALKGQTVKTKRTFISPTSNAPVAFNTILSPWYLGDKKVGGITIAVGWSEIAIAKNAPVAEPEPVDDFDGSLLDMLKTVV